MSRTPVTEKTIMSIVLSLIIPPIGVYMEVGFTKHFWINILLTLLGYIPGVVHAILIITRK
jgi:uncharacterized membrane protein YqaE (UPF0057 family)